MMRFAKYAGENVGQVSTTGCNWVAGKKGRQVARNSHHTLGEAVDFRLPGISTRKVRDWARSIGLGGVGYYPSSGFIHVDVGKVRTWRGD